MSMTLTNNAVIKIKDLLAEENNPDINLRIYVQGGGCSGMQYGFTFDEKIKHLVVVEVVSQSNVL